MRGLNYKPRKLNMKNEIEICYLCGQKLGANIVRDHIPPKQFYAKSIRKIHNPNLFTLPVHKPCNESYQEDEVYFVNSLAPLAMDTYSGKAIWEDISKQIQRPEGNILAQRILKEFDPRPGGLILPHGKVKKETDRRRMERVAWKITRGLFFKEIRCFLPEDIPRSIESFSIDEEPPELFAYVRNTPPRGRYPYVFDYKYIDIYKPKFPHFWSWAMLFWEWLIIWIIFHDPECPHLKS